MSSKKHLKTDMIIALGGLGLSFVISQAAWIALGVILVLDLAEMFQ